MPTNDSRAGQLNAVIDPKLLFLAKLAARHRGITLIEFIEDAFKRSLHPAVVSGDEPTPGHEPRQKQAAPLWFEGLWSEDEATRLFYVGTTQSTLLSPKQYKIFNSVVHLLIQQGKKVTLKNFVASFDALEKGNTE